MMQNVLVLESNGSRMSLGVRALTDKEKNTNQCFASLITPKQKGEKKG